MHMCRKYNVKNTCVLKILILHPPPSHLGQIDTQGNSTARPKGNTARWTAWKEGGNSGLTSTSSPRSSTLSAKNLIISWPCPPACAKEMKATAAPRRGPKPPKGPSEPRSTSTEKLWTCASLSARWPATDAMARSKLPSEICLTDTFVFQIKSWAFSCAPGNTDWLTLKARCYGKASMTMFWLLYLSEPSTKAELDPTLILMLNANLEKLKCKL